MHVYVGGAFSVYAPDLVMIVADSVSEISFSDVDGYPKILVVEL